MTMTQMPKYEAYKDSREEWIGDVPSHWEIKKLKHIFYEKKHRQNMNLNCGSISFGEVVTKNDEKVLESTKASYQEVLTGEFLINPLNLNYDLISLRIALSGIDVVVSAGYIVVKENKSIDKTYFKYLLHRYDVSYMKLLGSGVRQTISFNHIANSLLLYPTLAEQTLIANFLDQKTAQLDEAIAIKQKQISLLKERKQIIIQQAVTQGLDPNVPMKDSGVEWIGEIPEHWAYEPIKYSLIGVTDCEHKTAPFVDESEYFVVRTTNVKNGKLVFDGAKYTHEKGFKEWTRRGIPKAGDVLLTREAPAGEACIVPDNHKVCLGQRMVWLKIDRKRLLPEFAISLIYSSVGRTYIDFLSSGSTVLHFNMADINNIPVLLPPLDEQVELVQYIESSSNEIDINIDIQNQQIEKLKEYKNTLINSAVTGKIKITPEMVEQTGS